MTPRKVPDRPCRQARTIHRNEAALGMLRLKTLIPRSQQMTQSGNDIQVCGRSALSADHRLRSNACQPTESAQ